MRETVERIKNKENVFNNLLNIDKAILDEVNRNCSEKNIKKAAEYLGKARIIYIIGLGISKAIVDFLEFRLNRFGYNTMAITGGGEEVIDKLMGISQKDIIIGIGFFRPQKELLAALDLVKQKKIPIITITDSELSYCRQCRCSAECQKRSCRINDFLGGSNVSGQYFNINIGNGR